MVLVDLVIDSGAERRAAAWNRSGGAKIDDVVIRIEHLGHDQCFVIDVALVEIDEERCFLFRQWATEVSAVLARLNRRPFRSRENGLREFSASSLKLNET